MKNKFSSVTMMIKRKYEMGLEKNYVMFNIFILKSFISKDPIRINVCPMDGQFTYISFYLFMAFTCDTTTVKIKPKHSIG